MHMKIAKSPQGTRTFSRHKLMAINIHFQPNSFQLIHLKPKEKNKLKFVTTLLNKHIVGGKLFRN